MITGRGGDAVSVAIWSPASTVIGLADWVVALSLTRGLIVSFLLLLHFFAGAFGSLRHNQDDQFLLNYNNDFSIKGDYFEKTLFLKVLKNDKFW